jgi:hypothetical protein
LRGGGLDIKGNSPGDNFAIEWLTGVLGEINGPPKEAQSEAKQAAALDWNGFEAIESFGGTA